MRRRSELLVPRSREMDCVCMYNSRFGSVYLGNNERPVDRLDIWYESATVGTNLFTL